MKIISKSAPVTPSRLSMGVLILATMVTQVANSNNTCQEGALTIPATSFNSGAYTRASETSITTQNSVVILPGANVIFRAPWLRFGNGFQVASGALFQAKAEAVDCWLPPDPPSGTEAIATLDVRDPSQSVIKTYTPGALTKPETTRRISPYVGANGASRAQDAPEFVARAEDLPDWIRNLTDTFGIDLAAISQTLVDAQGRWLLFESPQAILPADGNGNSDIYRLDLQAATLSLISHTAEGMAGNGASRYPATDGSGEWVVFHSDAEDLVNNDANGLTDIFVHDVRLGQNRRLTLTATQASAHPSIDFDGQDLVYDQHSKEGGRLVLVDSLAESSTTARLSLDEDLNGNRLDNHHPAISSDGRWVAYIEEISANGDHACQVHFYDRDSGDFRLLPCPEELEAARENLRTCFSRDSGQFLGWLPGVESPVIVPNPFGCCE